MNSGPRAAPGDAPSIIEGLAVLPVFFNLRGRRVAIVGGGEAVAWKAELMQAAGARVDVFSAEPCDRLRELSRARAGVTLVARAAVPADLDGAALALADCESMAEAERFRALARSRGVPANVIDKPEASDIQFGALIDRSPLVVAVSTDGASPILAQAVRGRIEALLPETARLWAGAAKSWRARLAALRHGPGVRRKFWERLNEAAFSTPGRAPGPGEFDHLLEAAKGAERREAKGRVTLVGAGPGDPDLLTLKALRTLQTADVVLCDDLVAPSILGMARREARKLHVGKRGYRPSCEQDEIIALMIRLAREGKHVARLKGGDPMIFGRAAEEISALRAAGIPTAVVPGVTAALGAAASLQLSLTERVTARRLQFITAHARDGRLPEDIDWRALADPRASTVVYMGVRTLSPLIERLLAHGADPSTPALLVERATCADERVLRGTLATLPAAAAAMAPSGPCLILVGAAFSARAEVERALKTLGAGDT